MINLNRAIEAALVGNEIKPALQKLEKAAQGMEQMFVKQLVATMRKAMPGASGDSYATGMYKDMFDDALAESISKRGDFGLAKQVFETIEDVVTRQEFAKARIAIKAKARASDE